MTERLKVPHRLRQFCAGRRAVSLVEFAVIAVPFLLLTVGAIEVALVLWGSYELENATASAARLVRTGQAQTQDLGAEGLKARMCAQVAVLTNCTGKLHLNVQTFPSFSAVAAPAALDGGSKPQGDFLYEPGGPGEIVLLSAFYEWPLSPITGSVLANLPSGNMRLVSTAVFRNEPFRR